MSEDDRPDKLERAGDEYMDWLQSMAGVLSKLPTAVIVVSWQGRIIGLNARAQTLTGYRRGELVGRPVEILVPDEAKDVHRSTHLPGYLAAPRERPMGEGLRAELVRQDGTRLAVEVALNTMPAPGGPWVLAVVRPITEAG